MKKYGLLVLIALILCGAPALLYYQWTANLSGTIAHPYNPSDRFEGDRVVIYRVRSRERAEAIEAEKLVMMADPNLTFWDFWNQIYDNGLVPEREIPISKGVFYARVSKGWKLIAQLNKDISWAEVVEVRGDTVVSLDSRNAMRAH